MPLEPDGFAYMDALEQAVIEAAADPQVRALVFTADGLENFSVGMDLKQLVRRATPAVAWRPCSTSAAGCCA